MRALGLEKLGPPTRYHCRHGGPFADIAARRRSLKEVKSRGRWEDDRSVKRYVRGGRVGEQLQRLPRAQLRRAVAASRRIGEILSTTSGTT